MFGLLKCWIGSVNWFFRARRIILFFFLGLFLHVDLFQHCGGGREHKWVVVAVACEWS
jgi:hypothetical protein